MNAIGFVAVVLFAVGWLGGVVAWFYATYHLVAGKFSFDEPHGRQFAKGSVAFIGCWLFAFANGLIGTWFGGWHIAGN